jgi:hypothetical protein
MKSKLFVAGFLLTLIALASAVEGFLKRKLSPVPRSWISVTEAARDEVLNDLYTAVRNGQVVRPCQGVCTRQALATAKNIEKAIKSYRCCGDIGNPTSLHELVEWEHPFLEGGVNAISDPWGRTFQYTIEPDPNGTGDEIFVVFTIDPYGDEIRWPPKAN